MRLQSQDKQKYGYITDKILSETVEANKNELKKTLSSRISSKDERIKEFLCEVEKESGISIFNKKTGEMENINDLEVIMRLEEKIEAYEEEHQLSNKYMKERK